MQKKQSVEPPKVLSKEEEAILAIMRETGLTRAQVLGEHIESAEEVQQFELSKPLVPEDRIRYLPTRMQDLHDWYMKASAKGLSALLLRIGDQHLFRGDDHIMIEFLEFWFLFRQDALDKSLIAAWVL